MRSPNATWAPGGSTYGNSTKYSLTVHCTANTAPAVNEASFQRTRTDGTSAHFFFDKSRALQCVDTTAVCGHAGSRQANTNSIALEFCGKTNWSRETWIANINWALAAKVIVDVCLAHKIDFIQLTNAQLRANPRSNGFYTHAQATKVWGSPGSHTDPEPNFPMDVLKAAVDKEYYSRKGSTAVASAKTLPHEVHVQDTGYYCGPASVRTALSSRGKSVGEGTLATKLGTTTFGTNSANDITRVLNSYEGAKYRSTFIPGQDATASEKAAFKSNLVKSINAGYPVVANVVGTGTDVNGNVHSYGGGHYVPVVGYRNNGNEALVSDVAIGRDYWMNSDRLATWIAARGYSHAASATATPPAVKHPDYWKMEGTDPLWVITGNNTKRWASAEEWIKAGRPAAKLFPKGHHYQSYGIQGEVPPKEAWPYQQPVKPPEPPKPAAPAEPAKPKVDYWQIDGTTPLWVITGPNSKRWVSSAEWEAAGKPAAKIVPRGHHYESYTIVGDAPAADVWPPK